VELVGDRDQGPVDGETAGGEVDFTPPQAEELASSHAGVRRQPEGGEEAVRAGFVQKHLQLLGRPGPHHFVGPATFGGFGLGGDVADHEPAPQRVGEGLADDDVDLQHRLRVEAHAAGFSVEEQLGVEALEMFGTEPAQRHGAEVRHDVLDDPAVVGVPGARPKADPFGRQPPLQEVGGDG